MVFCYQNCSGPTVRNNCSSDRENRLRLESEGREFAKNFEIAITIYSNSARLEQFLVTQCFLTCSWRLLISNKFEQLEFKLKNIMGIYGDLET